MKETQIPFYKPWINGQDRKSVFAALKSRWLSGGPIAGDFEKQFSEYVGTKHAVAVNSCTAALHLAMRALNVGPGDEVIVPVLTFAATANAAIFCGAKPVFADIDERTFNISPKDVMEKVTSKTKAIIPVHYGGQPCDMKELAEIADDNKFFIVEDCAHSLGAKYADQLTGSLGVIGCFSFYATKIITTLEGGMLTTNDEEIDRKVRILREHGMTRNAINRESSSTWFYDVVDLGYNYRLTEAQSALGISQLNRIEEGIRRRLKIARFYTKQFTQKGAGVTTPYEASNRSHIYHLYTIMLQSKGSANARDALFRRLIESGIQPSVHYTPLHKMSFYKQFLKKQTQFPIADKVCREILSLPLYPTLTLKEAATVARRIKEF
jgi:perosamine synthetase